MKKNYWLFGGHLSIHADEQKTGGTYDMIEGTMQKGMETPLHLHTKYSEHVYMLEGEIEIYTPDETVVLKPGDDYFIPVNTPHSISPTGNGNNRSLVVAYPSGFAELIRHVGTADDGTGVPVTEDPDATMQRFMTATAKIGDEILGPPGTRL
ncbi:MULTISPECIES: cupin domain-containing protein [unclassified Pedobacter]|uniref:cupin domain-containing protein n=1 Tax=unclassified Pedobacter TaxID=2628915 RepID=UPI00293D9216|nr:MULTISPECIES: cupin domain-containing protein [unclassified Pedobacter]